MKHGEALKPTLKRFLNNTKSGQKYKTSKDSGKHENKIQKAQNGNHTIVDEL